MPPARAKEALRPSVAFISIYLIAWVTLAINTARSDTATSVRPALPFSWLAVPGGQRPRCATDSTPGAGEATGGATAGVSPLPKPAPS